MTDSVLKSLRASLSPSYKLERAFEARSLWVTFLHLAR